MAVIRMNRRERTVRVTHRAHVISLKHVGLRGLPGPVGPQGPPGIGGGGTWGEIDGDISAQKDLQTALDSKEGAIAAGLTSQYWRGDKSWHTLDKSAVGLGSVDNTSDLNKPISIAAQTALDGKADTIHVHAIADVTSLQSTLDGKEPVISAGTTSQYWRGDKSWQNLTTSAIPDFATASDARIAAQKAQAGGLATLDGSSKIPTSQLPALAITDTFVVSSQVAMLALSAQTGDVAVRSDLNKSFILAGSDPTQLSAWQELLTPGDAVLSVNGQTGAVTLTTTDVNEGTRLYYTDARARAALSGTTNQVNYSSSTGVISLPQNIHTGATPQFAGLTLTGTLTGQTVVPSSTTTYNLGSTSAYYSNAYAQRVNLNSTAYLDGATAGVIGINGLFDDATNLKNAGNFTLNGGGAVYRADTTSSFNQVHSVFHAVAANNFAGSRTNRLFGFELSISHSATSQTASLLGGQFIRHTPNAANSTITKTVFSSGQLNFANQNGMSVGSFFAYDLDSLGSSLTGGNTASITNLAVFHMPDLGNPTAVTITNRYGIWIEDAAALNLFAGNVQIGDGKAIIAGTSSGLKIGTSTSQKLGFYNATPVVRPSLITDFSYNASNSTTDRSFDADATTLDELADVVATLAGDLVDFKNKIKSTGLLA